MKTTRQIIWETKSEMYNRIWDAMNNAYESLGAEADLEDKAMCGGLAIVKELNKIKNELEELKQK